MSPDEICELTGLEFCGPDCGCGENSGLLFFPTCHDTEEWVPDWMNGSTPESVEKWIQEHPNR